MRYELTDHEWAAIKPMVPNKPRGLAPVNDPKSLPRRSRNRCWSMLSTAAQASMVTRSVVERNALRLRPSSQPERSSP
jgi:transposase